MSKYVDLIDIIYNDSVDASQDEIRSVLEWLDDYHVRVTGRTMTETEFARITGKLFQRWNSLETFRTHFRDELFDHGFVIVEDPEPSNTDRLEKLLRESGFEFFTSGFRADARELAEWLNSDRVKAPGGDDE